MKILRFSWENFRNLPSGEFSPNGGVNVLFGKNAQGKTNLLEAMWLFTGERSFRGARDAEMVGPLPRQAALRLDFYGAGREQTAAIRFLAGRRRAELNGVPKRSCSALIGAFQATVFSPDHLSLLQGGPAGRRNFLDAALSQIRPSYAASLARYNRVLAQRNALLKEISRRPAGGLHPAGGLRSELLETLEVWDGRLVRAGQEVAARRRQYLEKIAVPAAQFYSGMCRGRESLDLIYEASTDSFEEDLAACRGTDLATGHTGVGPHRDDMKVLVSGRDARAYASQGQKRSAVVAMKLAEAAVLTRESGEEPVVFLDDVLSELDEERQSFLLERLDRFQVFLTCTARCPRGQAPAQCLCGQAPDVKGTTPGGPSNLEDSEPPGSASAVPSGAESETGCTRALFHVEDGRIEPVGRRRPDT